MAKMSPKGFKRLQKASKDFKGFKRLPKKLLKTKGFNEPKKKTLQNMPPNVKTFRKK